MLPSTSPTPGGHASSPLAHASAQQQTLQAGVVAGVFDVERELDTLAAGHERFEGAGAAATATLDRNQRIAGAVAAALPDAVGLEPATGLRVHDPEHAIGAYFRSGAASAPATVQDTSRVGFRLGGMGHPSRVRR